MCACSETTYEHINFYNTIPFCDWLCILCTFCRLSQKLCTYNNCKKSGEKQYELPQTLILWIQLCHVVTIKCLISVQAYAPRFSKICHWVRLIGTTVRYSIMGHMSVCTIIWKYYHPLKIGQLSGWAEPFCFINILAYLYRKGRFWP